jgi:hypothetical protein
MASMETEKACTPFLVKVAFLEFENIFFWIDIIMTEFLYQSWFALLLRPEKEKSGGLVGPNSFPQKPCNPPTKAPLRSRLL